MFSLNLLGGASLEGQMGPVSGKATHKRRIAVLAILAAGRGRPVGRERVIGLLWPEHSSDAARHLLSEALYVLRKELGEAAILSSGGEVALNGEVVRSDVQAFEAAVEEGDLQGAAQVYRGPFLDGFYVSGALEFERWAESERDRLARAHGRALECLAEAGERAGRPQEAAEWWRRLAVADPYNSRVGVRLMLALDAAGERAAALWFAESHTALLREEVGVEPDQEFAAAVERLRTEPVRFPPPAAPAAPAVSPLHNGASASPPSPGTPAPSRPPPDAPAERTPMAFSAPPVEREAEHESAPSPQAAPEPEPALSAEREAEHESASPAKPEAEDASASSAEAEPEPRSSAEAEPEHALPADTAAEPEPAPSLLPRREPEPASFVDSAADAGPAPSEELQAAGGSAPRLDGPADPGLAPRIASRPEAELAASADVPARLGHGTPPGTTLAAVPSTAGARRWKGPALLAGLLAVLAGLAGVLALTTRRNAPDPSAGFDARRIAVLYFDDHSAGGELGYLASGLTEMLIHELSQVEALDVISRNGVKQYRNPSVPFDSLVADLRVGSVVEGSVQRAGDSVRVTVQLVDAATRSHLESRTLLHPASGVLSLEDAVAREVSGFLRRRLGQEVRLRQTRAGTRSEAALRLVWQASEAREGARSAARAPAPGTDTERSGLLARADSLLALAERADPGWAHPALERGWVAYEAGRLSRGPPADARFNAAQGAAARVLAREPGNGRALELRGVVRFERAARAGSGQEARVDSAELDLRAAVQAEPGLAGAWARLSQLLRYRGRVAESDVAARRALAEDAYLDEGPAILNQLFLSAMLLGDYPHARSLCSTGRQRFPADWQFLECELTLLREDRSRPADPERAWRLVAELDRVDPPERAAAGGRAYSPVYRQALAAAILARAGQRDSARAVLARARRMVAGDAERTLDLAYDEAYVLLQLGEREAARARLTDVLAHRSWLRDFARRDPLFRELFAPAAPPGTPRVAETPGSRP
ncbi:MAG TPA: BTAD domain-containing putative transcriptional regulator [Longimicrobium sp.]|nr:BTAD domain-containing putative transcriptional regulator [Longimicrobium sp.]